MTALPIGPTTTNPAIAFIAQEVAAGIPVVGVSGSSPSDPKWALQFGAGATNPQKVQAQADAISFDWTVVNLPTLEGFVADCLTDSNLDIARKTVALFLARNSLTTINRIAIFAQAKTELGAGDAGLARILTHAGDNGLTIQ